MQSTELSTPDGPTGAVVRGPRRARISASAGFAVQGLCFATLISRVPVFQEKYGLDETQLTITLAAVPIVAGVGSVLAGVLAPRIGSAAVLRAAAIGVASMTALAGITNLSAVFFPTIALFGLFLGAVDASMNMQGTAVQRRYGRSILASCHAWWSIAGIAGALAAIVAADVPLAWFLGTAGGVGLLISLVFGPGLLKKGDEEHNPETSAVTPLADGAATEVAARKVRTGLTVALVGTALMIMFIGDAATTNWSGIFLRDVLAADNSVVSAGLFGYLLLQFLGRTVADRVIGRIGGVATVVLGGLLSAGGFAMVALGDRALLAVVGFALVGLGMSVVVPLTFSAADALDPAGTGSVIAKVNLFNYAGVIVGSAVIGVLADPAMLGDLRLAFAVPGGLALLIILLAPAFRVVDTARARAARAIASR